jgi:hypothetical protein
MHDFTVPLLDEFVKLWGLTEDVNFDSQHMEQDIIAWTRTTLGEYSAKPAYEMQFEGGIFSSFPNIVWKVRAPSKCKFFMSLLLQNRVWTADRLLNREWPNSYFCQLCYRNLQTTNHLFVECPISCSIWRAADVWCGRTSLKPKAWNNKADFVSWFADLAGSSMDTMTKGSRSLAILVTWKIWCERNNRIFNNKEQSVARILEDIKDTTRLWVLAGAKHLAALVVNQSSE